MKNFNKKSAIHFPFLSFSILSVISLMVIAPRGQTAELPISPMSGFSLDYREIRAQLTPRRYTTLSTELGAKISRIPVREGEHFQEGQTLIQFDCALQKAQLDKARTQLKLLKVNL